MQLNALDMAVRIAEGVGPEMLDTLSEVVAGHIPHLAAADMTPYCAVTHMHKVGDPQLVDAITNVELGALLAYVTAGRPWQGMARIAGEYRPVLAVASDRAPSGALVVFVKRDAEALDDEIVTVAQALWDLLTTFHYQFSQTSEPTVLARTRAIAQARATTVAEMSEAHTASVAGLLGVLRSRHFDDATARAVAIDMALNALEELRVDAERHRSATGEEPAGRAFRRLADSLRPLLQHSPVSLELDPPRDDRLVHAEAAQVARVTVRAVVLAMLQQDNVHRVRVGWRLEDDVLAARIRDDGPGELGDEIDLGHVAERVRTQRGRFEVDAVPGWGLTVTIRVPLVPRRQVPDSPLAGLGERELDVLQRLALGHRNRVIAKDLHISESTVKFHVANILAKLDVGSRTEAAAVFHASATGT